MGSLVTDLADALGVSVEEAANEVADSPISLPRVCSTCGWEDFEHRPGEFGPACPYGPEAA